MNPSDGFACTLPHEGVVHLRGDGIAEFLQGQLTCDTRRLATGHSVSGALCDARGRVLTDLRVLLLDDRHCVLRLREDLAQDMADTLGRYARFSRIDVTADDGTLRVAAARGAALEELLAALQLPLPRSRGEVTATRDAVCVRVYEDGCEFLLPAGALARLEHRLDDDDALRHAWAADELRAGLFRVGPADTGLYTPQALNYDRAGLVSFSKGCYTGQEVIARLHYRGRSKRRLAVLSTAGPALPMRGAAIEDASGSDVGELLCCIASGNGEWVCAAMLRDDPAPGTNFHTRDPAADLHALSLPYAAPVP